MMRTSFNAGSFFIKRILCIFLSFIIFMTSSSEVDASVIVPPPLSLTTEVKEQLRNVLIEKGIIVDGGFLDGFFDYFVADREIESIDGYAQAIVDAAKEKLGITISAAIAVTEKGQYVYEQSLVDVIVQLFDEYLKSTPEAIDVVWMPVITEKNLNASWFSSMESYYKAMSVLSSHNLVGFYRGGNSNVPIMMDYGTYVDDDYNSVSVMTDKYVYTPVFYDLSDYVLYHNAAFNDSRLNSFAYLTSTFGNDTQTNISIRAYLASSNGVFLDIMDSPLWNLGSGWVVPSRTFGSRPAIAWNPFYSGVLSSYSASSGLVNIVLVASSESGITYVPYFSTLNAYKEWITGQGSYYRFDSGYQGGDITINPDADYSQITDAIADVMKQSIANGDTMAKMLSQMQVTFSKTLADISGTLGNIGDNTAETNTWLEKIYQLLEDQQQELQDYFESAGTSMDELIGMLSHTSEDGKVTSVYTLLADLLILFRVQQEDLQQFMSDGQDYFQTFPVMIKGWISAAVRDIQDALDEVTEAIRGISINIDYGDVDNGGSDGESLWSQLGKGLAKILTSILGLLKVLIFKGLDALIYLVGIIGDNITAVFEDMEIYVDRVALRFEDGNSLFSALGGAIPESLMDMLVIFVFVMVICAVVSYLRR